MQELAMKLSESMSIIPSAYRNDQHIMRYPLFTTSKIKRFDPIEYEFIDKNGDRRFITVTANAKYGMADQRDADILRYALTKMGEVFLKTGYAAPYVKVSPYELLRGIGKDAGVKGYCRYRPHRPASLSLGHIQLRWDCIRVHQSSRRALLRDTA
jgi:plasmid replication initiation protein